MKITVMMIVGILTLFAGNLPEMAFLGYNGDTWKVCVTQTDGTLKETALEQEPHSFDYNFQTAQILYAGSFGKLYLYTQGRERELKLSYDKNTYTQPGFSCKKGHAYAVELIDGNSKSTRIVSIDLNNDAQEVVVQQNSSQFEPSEINDHLLLFTSLTCNKGCGKLMQEIWKKNEITGESDQLTLLNAFSNNPTVHDNDHWLFFSSNRNGDYHIWAKDLNTDKRSVEVTHENATDTFPAALGKGSFLYVRQNKSKYSIMRGDIRGNSHEIKLLREYDKIRQLKVGRCYQ